MAKSLPPRGEILFDGVTVNEFATAANFAAYRNQGIGAAVLRATAGDDYTDARLNQLVENARENALRIGFYHYLTAEDEAGAREQAQRFVQAISGYDYALRPAMLFETLNGLSIESANRIALAFLAAVESTAGVAPVVYTDAQSANLLWNRSIAERYPLWVIDESDAALPQAGNSPWKGWVGWQYRTDAEDPSCPCAGVPVSRFTSGMLKAEIVLPTPPEEGEPARTKLICINVAYGDTLSGIARLFRTSVDSIVKINDIQNPDLILPGQRLYLRVDSSVPYPCCDSYTVRKGDSLSAIAQRFDLNWRRIASINQISNPNLIFPGQVLKLGVCD